MMAPGCSLWWLLAAVLLGWLLCGWFARQYLPLVTGGSAAQDREIQRLRAELAALRAGARPGASVDGAPGPGAEASVQAAARMAPGFDEAPSEIDVAAARAAGIDLEGPEDLRVIEGVGPKIAQVFQGAGIRTFSQVAAMTPAGIRSMLDEAGPGFRIADPQTWPEQAALAAANRWVDLKALQDALVGGRKV
jgi:predicted flap endonuclease-1-like 5' DNA nuclease